jgi:NitT/TauT family transport system permease protein
MTTQKPFQLALTMLATLTVVFGFWLCIDTFVAPPEFIFPRLLSVIKVFSSSNAQIAFNTLMTAEASASGLVIAVLGSAIAVAATIFFPMIRTGILGISLAIKATPIVALAPLLIIWLGTGLESKIAAAAIPCFFPILASALESIQQTPSRWTDVAKVFGASNWEVFAKIRIPAALPWILTGVRIAAPLSIVGAIVGELVGARAGLGYVIIRASYQLQTDVVFAAILSAAALAGVFTGIILGLEFIMNRYDPEQG